MPSHPHGEEYFPNIQPEHSPLNSFMLFSHPGTSPGIITGHHKGNHREEISKDNMKGKYEETI